MRVGPKPKHQRDAAQIPCLGEGMERDVDLPLDARELRLVLLDETQDRPAFGLDRAGNGVPPARINASEHETVHQRAVAGFQNVTKIDGVWIGAKPQQQVDQVMILGPDGGADALVVIAIGIVAVRQQQRGEAVKPPDAPQSSTACPCAAISDQAEADTGSASLHRSTARPRRAFLWCTGQAAVRHPSIRRVAEA